MYVTILLTFNFNDDSILSLWQISAGYIAKLKKRRRLPRFAEPEMWVDGIWAQEEAGEEGNWGQG